MKKNIAVICFASMCIFSFFVSLSAGAFPLVFEDIIKDSGSPSFTVFFNLRLPRAIAELFAGAALGLSGAVYQTVFGNPLASPDITGVASGASLGAAAAIVLGAGTSLSVMGGAFTFGMLSLLFVMLLVKWAGTYKTGSYILSGIIVSSLSSAFLMMLKNAADPEKELAGIEYWIMGSFSSVTLKTLLPLLPFIIVPVVLLLLFSPQCIILSLGDETAEGTGLSVKKWRFILLFLSTLAVSSVVSAGGVISFAGLIAPHIVFLFRKKRDGLYFLLSALSGSILLIWADIAARSFSASGELPLSIFTVIFSVPVLVFLLLKRGKDSL